MKVLHVIPSVAPWRGGPSVAIRAITRGLAQRGLDTHVATTDDNQPAPLKVPLGRPVEEDGVTYHYFSRQTRFYVCSLPFSAWFWRSAIEYDLIHIHTVFSYCSNAAAWIAHQKAIPYIIRPLGVLNRWGFQNRRPWLKQMSFALIEKRLLSLAAAVQYTTRMEAEEAAELDFSHHPVIIPNPVELPASVARSAGQFRARYPELAGRRIILFLSRIDQKKGLDLLLPAFREVLRHDPTAALVIAGEGDAAIMGRLRVQSSAWGMERSVYWPGFLTGAAKLASLADADIFVLPSYSENFGIAVVEAMGAGLPVVITDQVGIHRDITDSRAGVVTPATVSGIASSLLRLLSDAPARAEFGRNAQRLAASRYSITAVTTQLLETYRAVCETATACGAPHPV